MAASMSLKAPLALKPKTALQSKVNKTVAAARPMAVTRRQVTTAAFPTDANIIISGANASLLFLGRFVFLPYQRKSVEKAGLPVQDGKSHFDAGDARAAEMSSLFKTGDPAGFNIVDVMAWGSLGHAIGFAAVAALTNSYGGPSML
eukprot:CAMPEP_0182866058 /NCGR_PEP_ID=MMETSP0034_2-20130328/8012_1 /TAXON_ID=156128 /ORGANISM="Nephroselmis pyriformis, Strain CCMP717" /LENGTH=145 /DNA_ID=CAMNT_0024998381 /DNA_START=45 /DNA_END=482 /DNA_ORIENTATION=-